MASGDGTIGVFGALRSDRQAWMVPMRMHGGLPHGCIASGEGLLDWQPQSQGHGGEEATIRAGLPERGISKG